MMTMMIDRQRVVGKRPPRSSVRRERVGGSTRRGLSLAEVVVSTMLTGVLLTAALRTVGTAARSSLASAQMVDAMTLARQLLDEITVLPYEDPNQGPEFGPESGESDKQRVREGFDDVDDYRDWEESPPRHRDGTPIPGYVGWSREVEVEKVDPETFSVRSDLDSDLGLRRVTVTVTPPSGESRSVSAYRSRDGGILQPRGVTQELVTWVGVSLETAGGEPVSGGVSITNHATDRD